MKEEQKKTHRLNYGMCVAQSLCEAEHEWKKLEKKRGSILYTKQESPSVWSSMSVKEIPVFTKTQIYRLTSLNFYPVHVVMVSCFFFCVGLHVNRLNVSFVFSGVCTKMMLNQVFHSLNFHFKWLHYSCFFFSSSFNKTQLNFFFFSI